MRSALTGKEHFPKFWQNFESELFTELENLDKNLRKRNAKFIFFIQIRLNLDSILEFDSLSSSFSFLSFL